MEISFLGPEFKFHTEVPGFILKFSLGMRLASDSSPFDSEAIFHALAVVYNVSILISTGTPRLGGDSARITCEALQVRKIGFPVYNDPNKGWMDPPNSLGILLSVADKT